MKLRNVINAVNTCLYDIVHDSFFKRAYTVRLLDPEGALLAIVDHDDRVAAESQAAFWRRSHGPPYRVEVSTNYGPPGSDEKPFC
jgi:hypothetical protein